jgi:hypothetical protein
MLHHERLRPAPMNHRKSSLADCVRERDLGTAMIVQGVVAPMEIAHLPYKNDTYETMSDAPGLEGERKSGGVTWPTSWLASSPRWSSTIRLIGKGNVT